VNRVDVQKFLELADKYTVIDTRSPSEYLHGHIPGARNIPLFLDKEREAVGIKYKKSGRTKAILRGLELAGPGLHLKLAEALKTAVDGTLLIHCWRGGMRSEAMAWLFSLADLNTILLEGGYKAYRNHILTALSQKRKSIILGGMTGSSKTHILRHLRNIGRQVIDLEALANHKGSAFGGLGQPFQPTSEHFANLLYNEWKLLDPNKPVWLEDESRNIGNIFMPDNFYSNMIDSPAVILIMDIKTRIPRLVEEYSKYPPEIIRASILKISKRLGGDNTTEAIRAVNSGDFSKAIEITLKYYDKAYLFSINKRDQSKIIYVKTKTDNIEINARKILEVVNDAKY